MGQDLRIVKCLNEADATCSNSHDDHSEILRSSLYCELEGARRELEKQYHNNCLIKNKVEVNLKGRKGFSHNEPVLCSETNTVVKCACS